MADDPIPEKDLKNLMEQLGRVHGDKDRIRLINAAADGWSFTCQQVKDLLEEQHYGDAAVATAINLFDRVVDEDKFEEVVIEALPYEEDKKQVREALGFE